MGRDLAEPEPLRKLFLLAGEWEPGTCIEGEADSGIAVLRAAVDQALLHRLLARTREARLKLTADNATQFTSTRFFEILDFLTITHRRASYHHPECNSYIEQFHRTMKEDEVSLLCFTSASLAHSSGDLSPRFRAPLPRPGQLDQAGTLSVCSRICVRVRRERLVLPSD